MEYRSDVHNEYRNDQRACEKNVRHSPTIRQTQIQDAKIWYLRSTQMGKIINTLSSGQGCEATRSLTGLSHNTNSRLNDNDCFECSF